MTLEIKKHADNSNDRMESVVKDLTDVIEREVKAFQSLLEALLDQQASILKGDVFSVSLANEEVESIVTETKKLEKERCGKSKDLSRCLNVEGELTLSKIIPRVELRYADRLKELRHILEALSKKIQRTNERNNYLLEHSLQFVDNCLRLLVEGSESKLSYDRKGKIDVREVSLYSGLG